MSPIKIDGQRIVNVTTFPEHIYILEGYDRAQRLRLSLSVITPAELTEEHIELAANQMADETRKALQRMRNGEDVA